MQGNIIKMRLMSFALEKTPVLPSAALASSSQYQEYENSLLGDSRNHPYLYHGQLFGIPGASGTL